MNKSRLIIAVALTVTLSGCQTRQNALDNLRTASTDLAKTYAAEMGAYAARHGREQATEKGMESVKRQLKDPESVRFQNTRLSAYAGGLVLCGEVNAKNSFGGYVGFRRFVAGATSATAWDTDRHPGSAITAASNAGITDACGPF